MANEYDYEFQARRDSNATDRPTVFAILAVSQNLDRIAVSLEKLVKMVKDSEESTQRPCNEMGGGSAGLDTAGDYAVHCSKPDRHDGPHSYEGAEHANQQ